MIRFSGLTKRFRGGRTTALDHLDLEVRSGEILGLVGLNGAGKTTAIRLACGLILPTSGGVQVDGHDIVKDHAAASRTLGWVPELPNFEPQANALDLLEYFAGYHGTVDDQKLKGLVELLRQVGLGEVATTPLGEYSQGMRKRFALAAALLHDPTNLLLDELLNGLDPEGIRFCRQLLLRLRGQGVAILLSGHILTEVEQLADRFAILHRGKLVEVLDRTELAHRTRARLRVVLREPDARVTEVLANYGHVESDGRAYLVTPFTGEPHEVNAALVAKGFHVREFRPEHEDLEAYFFRRIGGAA